MDKMKLALIGIGQRGTRLYYAAIKNRADVEIVALCDNYEKRLGEFAAMLEKEVGKKRLTYTDFRKCIDESGCDCVIVSAAWDAHIEITMYAMERKVAVGCEVGGAYSIESLWELVRCYERTKTPVMMLENCCYSRMELLALNMKRKGLLGEIVHLEGAYRHDLREEVATGEEKHHYRLLQYLNRNCENYPTHELGPIAKIVDINCGNKFDTLYSVGSKSVGMENYVAAKNIEKLKGKRFAQSDAVTTVIKCRNGETITLNLVTSLARYYSRSFLVEGTKGLVCEENQSVFLEQDFPDEYFDWRSHFGNVEEYYKRYDHKLWVGGVNEIGEHSDIDKIVVDEFFDAVKNGTPMPIDVYDMASLMAVSVLSEQSIASGQVVTFPDFTDGKWITRKNNFAL